MSETNINFTTTIFKIRRTTDGLYSKGGYGATADNNYSFNKHGKGWGGSNLVRSHIALLLERPGYGKTLTEASVRKSLKNLEVIEVIVYIGAVLPTATAAVIRHDAADFYLASNAGKKLKKKQKA